MKKSKIIVPALAMIAFTTAASISGTVAWFTANRSVSIDAGTYAVVKTNADLQCELKGGVQTSVEENAPTVVKIAENTKLTDASFDHSGKKFTIPTADGSGINSVVDLFSGTETAAERNTRLNTALLADATNKIYRAFTWEMNLSIYFGDVASADYGLYIDTSTSVFTVGGGAAAKTAKGFRMAFIPATAPSGSSASTRVWADLQSKSYAKYIANPAAGKHFVPEDPEHPELDTDYIPATAYTTESHTLIDNIINRDVPEETGENAVNASQAIALEECLGTFHYIKSTKVTLSYTVVCWFEGTDPEIVSRDYLEDYQTVGVTLNLEAVPLLAS